MGTLNITSSSMAVSANYENQEKELYFNLNYTLDAETQSLISINGSVFSPSKSGTFIGSYNGNLKGDGMQYNFNGIVDLTKMDDIVSCVQEIESLIKNEE
jgi:hypothetical protein